jgi:hypothetical protein
MFQDLFTNDQTKRIGQIGHAVLIEKVRIDDSAQVGRFSIDDPMVGWIGFVFKQILLNAHVLKDSVQCGLTLTVPIQANQSV